MGNNKTPNAENADWLF